MAGGKSFHGFCSVDTFSFELFFKKWYYKKHPMGLFSKKEQSFVGIDVGASSMKLVELTKERGRARLRTYGSVHLQGLLEKESEENEEVFIELGKKLLQDAHVRTRLAVTALPMYSVFSSVIQLPRLKAKEMQEAVKWEAKKVIPLPLEEMILDWKVIQEKNASDSNSVRVLLTSAPKQLIQKYVNRFQKMGLKLLSLETEAFALIRSLVGNDTSTIMMIDFGDRTTNIMLISDGVPILSRSIEQGGREITALIARQTGLVPPKAEDYKKDLRIPLTTEMKEALSPIIDEIKYSFSLYENQHKKKVEKVILTGGTSLLPGLPEHISQIVFTKTYLGSPWARLVYPEDLTSLLEIVGPSMSVAAGLAMREMF